MMTATSQKAGIIPATRSPHSSARPNVNSALSLTRRDRWVSRAATDAVSTNGRRHKASIRIAIQHSPKMPPTLLMAPGEIPSVSSSSRNTSANTNQPTISRSRKCQYRAVAVSVGMTRNRSLWGANRNRPSTPVMRTAKKTIR